MKKVMIIGSLNMDFVVQVDHIPKPGETILAKNLNYVPGGKGANQAYASAKLGNDTTMLGCVGKDNFGDMLTGNLNSVGVDTKNINRTDVPTGMAFINVEESGDNCITVVAQSNDLVTKEYINQNIESIKQCDIIVFQFEIPIKTVLHAAKIAKEHNKKVILDPAPVPKDFPEELYRYVDIITPNETELERLTGVSVTSYDDTQQLKNAAKILHNKGIKTVIVTLGSQGVFLSDDKYCEIVKPEKVKAIDTTAAGDTFVGAFLAKQSQGENTLQSVKFANKASAVTCTRKGAQSSIPTLEEVNEFFSI